MCNEQPFHSEEYKGYTINIYPDDQPESPREWDNLGIMVCWHNRYNLGDEQPKESPQEYWEGCAMDDFIILPLFLYDHGGITMNTSGFSCPWDSGQVGYIYISKDDVRREYGWQRITKQREAKIIQYLKNEVQTYDDYLTGNVWGYEIEDSENDIDSCWGFYGDYDHPKHGVLAYVKMEIDHYNDTD